MKVLDFTPFRTPLAERGILVVEAFLAPDSITEFAIWDHDRICLVRRGELLLDHNGGLANLSQNEILFLPASTRHRWKALGDSHTALLVICFKPDFFRPLGPLTTLFDDFAALFPANEAFAPERALDTVAVRQILVAILRQKRAQKDESAAMITGLFIELVAILVSASKENPEFVNLDSRDSAFVRSVAYLNERLSDQISVSDLAAIANVSTRRYLDVFKRDLGATPKQYIIEQRIEIAKKLMVETGSILHSSLDAGFGNLSHFYRIFRRYTGMTPKQYIVEQTKSETY